MLDIAGKAFYTSPGVACEINTDLNKADISKTHRLKNYTLIMVESSARFEQSISRYRMSLWLELGMVALILLAIFTLTLHD
jgi:hypothetical protein